MRVTVSTEQGKLHSLDVSASLLAVDFVALVAAELGCASVEQLTLVKHGETISADKMRQTLQAIGICNDDLLLAIVRASDRNEPAQRYEQLRREILDNPQLMQQLQSSNPQLVDAALNNFQMFAQIMARIDQQRRQQQEEMALDAADPFDVEAQKRIEATIRQQQVSENFEAAVEHNPESFGRVIMLYIDVEINKQPVKAFVDSGAQATIMSPDLADRCGLSRLIDTRFAGIAHGVGTAKILGRVHAAEMKMSPSLFLMCSFTVMEGKGVDLLFGLDMLKRHQAIIDLEKNVLRIQGADIRFLSEHELPASARDLENIPEDAAASGAGSAVRKDEQAVTPSEQKSTLIGTEKGMKSTVTSSTSSSTAAAATTPAASSSLGAEGSPNEEHIGHLMALGVSRQEAIQALKLAGGNIDAAAGLLF